MMRWCLIAAVMVCQVAWGDCSFEAQNYENAQHNYNVAKDDLESELNNHLSCVNFADGNDDCSSEAYGVTNYQHDFESATNDLQDAKNNYQFCDDNADFNLWP